MRKRTLLTPNVLIAAALAPPAALLAQDLPGEGGVDRYEVGTALPPDDSGRPTVDMTLEGAMQRALEMNLDIQTARLSPRMQAYTLQAAQAFYTPTIGGSYGYNNATNQSTSLRFGSASATARTGIPTSSALAPAASQLPR